MNIAFDILIIDDEDKFRKLLARILIIENYKVQEAATAKAALQLLEKQHFHAIICDVKLPDAHGVDLVKLLKQQQPATAIILLTAYGNITDGVQAVKNGAYNYLVKGDNNAQIIPMIAQAIQEQNTNINNTSNTNIHSTFKTQIIGNSATIQAAIKLATKVAKSNATVLLTGETGTGKEVFAQFIHQNSTRAQKALIAVNCSALGKDILESELFGYKAGAFTGAQKDKKGLLNAADGGTIFLDELGEMSPELQAKLLRVIETQSFIAVGDTKTQHIDVRWLAATHRNLKQEAANGNFRLDLYYRLSVFEVNLPALRDRKIDINALATTFISQICNKMNKPILKMSSDFLDKLQHYQWQGNIRELKNIIERAVILTDTTVINIDVLPPNWWQQYENNLHSFELAEVEKLHILKILEHTNHNKTETARLLGIGLTTLYRKLDDFKIIR